jgi:outer membrane protease
MTKGILGAGYGGGHLNDEDWAVPSPPFVVVVPYSNTISGVDNDVSYVVADLGYDLWRGQSYSVAPFMGYSYFRQKMSAYGCTQIANPNSDCGIPLPSSLLVIIETDEWQALRLGIAAQIPLAPGIKLTADAAYLPYVWFSDIDNHVLRSLISPGDGNGNGVQLEGMLTYAVTDYLSLGVGGRYWSMWTTDGYTNFGGQGGLIPMRYAAEQAALMLQATYTFDIANDAD